MTNINSFEALEDRRRQAEAERRQQEDDRAAKFQAQEEQFRVAKTKVFNLEEASMKDPVQMEQNHWVYRGFHISLADPYSYWLISHPSRKTLPDSLRGSFTTVDKARRAIDFVEGIEG